MNTHVDITFDCLPLRSIGRFDVPVDASPELAELCHRITRAAEKHGLHNTYYVSNAHCVFHLTNDDTVGMIDCRFEGTVLTDTLDQKTVSCDLEVQLQGETCDWLTEPVVHWFAQTVHEAVRVEFDRFIAAGDLAKTINRIERLQAESDAQGGFLGLGL